jgi:hypothetical protein
MYRVYRADEKLFIYYAGPTFFLTEASRAHYFVVALGASCEIYACSSLGETMGKSTAFALPFFQ